MGVGRIYVVPYLLTFKVTYRIWILTGYGYLHDMGSLTQIADSGWGWGVYAVPYLLTFKVACHVSAKPHSPVLAFLRIILTFNVHMVVNP